MPNDLIEVRNRFADRARQVIRLALGILVLLLVNARLHEQAAAADPPEAGWVALFNGNDLAGWDVWLGRPKRDQPPIGLNNDPKQVFSVVAVDGRPAVRISGEIPGGLTSQKEYENYHLRVEFKWGEKNWRENFPRDGGILFHCVGPHGVQGGAWMESLECEVMAGHCGDFFSVFGPSAVIEVAPETKKLPYYGSIGFRVYEKGGEKFTAKKNVRVLIGKDYEKPAGEWNTIDVFTAGDKSVYLVNGQVTMVVHDARYTVDGKEVPLTRGKLQIISEWSELYYRTIALRPITAIPEQYLR